MFDEESNNHHLTFELHQQKLLLNSTHKEVNKFEVILE